MLVSTKGRYALRVMLELAERDSADFVTLNSLAGEQDISEKYLESILAVLSKAGVVEGLRGKRGGYRLTRRPEEYNVGEILRLTEGSLSPVSCLDGSPNRCERASRCKTLPLWERLDELICGYLDSVTLADLMAMSSDGKAAV